MSRVLIIGFFLSFIFGAKIIYAGTIEEINKKDASELIGKLKKMKKKK